MVGVGVEADGEAMNLHFTHDFIDDYELVKAGLANSYGDPFALVRFGDGERAVMELQPCVAADGWEVPEKHTPFTLALRESLTYSAEGWHVGLPCPCCQPDEVVDWWKSRLNVPPERQTYANLFCNANAADAARFFSGLDCATVGGAPKCTIHTPVNAVNKPWNIQGCIDAMIAAEKPLLVMAGPASEVLIHRYWIQCPPRLKQTCIDLGSALDPLLWGKVTRRYHNASHPNRTKQCVWERSNG